ncbi:cobalamin B12-binding domain-containing protein [Flavobacteriaceae bacterium F08102]|nr:cobalamin B12-binding domain-containing protein [Flavobacteriaceae bacterium F08102]
MKTYSMSQVTALTGLSAHLLRKWESRYSFITPMRTTTNIRIYSEEQLKILLNVSILYKEGIKISTLHQMSIDEIHEKVNTLFEDGRVQAEIKSLIVSMLNLDEQQFNHILQHEILRNGLVDTVQVVLFPFLTQVGILWGTNQAIPAQEHFISNIIRQKIFAAIDQLPLPEKNAKRIVLFLPEEEQHEIGLLLGAFMARKLGWKTFYLGQNVPFDNLKEVIDIAHPDLLMTLLISPLSTTTLTGFTELLNTVSCPLVYAGHTLPSDLTSCKARITHLENPTSLIAFLRTHFPLR